MKKNILRAIAISTFAIVVFFNISLNGKMKTADVNLGQEAQAAKVCTEYYGGEVLCCYSFQGSCLTSWGSYSFYNG